MVPAVPDPSSISFLTAFHQSLAEVPSEPRLLYSGGIDSSLAAFCLAHLGRAPRLVAVGLGGAPDLGSAADGASLLGTDCERRTLEPAAIDALLRRDGATLATLPEPARSVRVAFLLALDSLPEGPVVCGQGADELFGGYAHFQGIGAQAAVQRRSDDLRRLLEVDWPWAQAEAARRGQSLRSPFVAGPVVAAALSLPASAWFDPLRPKAWLRDVAKSHGLPAEIADRPKRAMQYGSRVAREVRRIVGRAREEGSGPPDPLP